MMEFSEQAKLRYKTILSHYPEKRAALLPVLTLAQREFGWISPEVAEYVGGLMDYPPSDVLSVASFYTMLHKKPAGKHHLDICKNLSCWLMGVNPCIDEIKRQLGVEKREVTADSRFSWDVTECLGSCGTAPAMQVGDRYYENLSPAKIAEIIEQLRNDSDERTAEPARMPALPGTLPGSMTKIVLTNIDKPDQATIAKYRERGGYKAIEKALAMDQSAVIDEVKASGLRGRGGAGFPTGIKWGFVPRTAKPTYLLCNADESEPGTFKDRLLMERDPHLMIEGMAIACYALNCHLSYIYIRGEYEFVANIVQKALDEAYEAKILGPSLLGRDYGLDIFIHLGQGAYICGEETSLIESLEGNRGYPRIKPPFPATHGFLASPTVVNNVETLAALPWIIQNGAAAHAAIGTEKSKGTKLFSVSGHVNKPGVYEVDMGYPLLDFINNEAGGIANGRKLKAVIPGGSSVPVMTAAECEGVLLDYESLLKAGSMLGSGGMIVLDETTSMPDTLSVIADFYAHESCGQCTPCREGTGWAAKILKNLVAGKGRRSDLDLLLKIADRMEGKTICPLADADVMPIRSFVTKFRSEFEALCSN